jgi:hypothetical protein
MTADYQIQYLPHNKIDKNKWDYCIQAATRSLVYNASWYLDAMAVHWDALVLNDYEAVIPLVWKRKFGIYYLYQPFFTAQLGITGNANSPAATDAFLKSLPSHFKFVDIDLDERNDTTQFFTACSKRVNMLLDITQNYAGIYKGYHRLAKRMIRKAHEKKLHIEVNAGIPESIAFYQQQYNARLKIKPAEYSKLTNMFQMASHKGHVISLAAKIDDRLLAIYILLKDQHYVYSVIGGSSTEGKETGAFYMLTDHAIKTVSGTDRLFRFEGSDLPGIAHFNQQFGAKPFYYNHLKLNRLPFLLRVFKK